jgi:hypothetical protein
LWASPGERSGERLVAAGRRPAKMARRVKQVA